MPGRPHKPTKVLKMQGTAQNCRLKDRDDELEVDGPFPDPPVFLGPAALGEWERVRGISSYSSCIKASDRAILTAYCILWGKLEEAGGLRATEWVVFISLAGKLGMTPADRSKVHVGKQEQDNQFAEFKQQA